MNRSFISLFIRRRTHLKIFGGVFLLILFLVGVQIVLANISPDYLKNGRTFDQETSYIQWNGSVGYVSLYHADGTSLPPSEGGGSCGAGCTETVTRIQNGGSVSGNFTYLSTFNVQVAYSGASGMGTAVIKACGQTIYTQNMYMAGSGTPGFVNMPAPAWSVPTAGDCTWSISATGGYVDFRAVTTAYRSTPAPTVDLKINASNGPLNLSAPASYTLSWTSTNAAACSASGSWIGNQVTNGSQAYNNVGIGAYTYTITCTNPTGSMSDSVTVNVLSAPTVSVNTPAAMTAPANYTATWTSTNAVTCTGASRFSGLSGLSGSKVETALPAGTYDYTITCTNAAGAQASDTKRTIVYAAPSVDVKVDGSDGPTLTRTGPVSYVANWTSANATQCTGSSRLAGYSGTSGSRSETNVPAGTTFDYTVTCQNAAGAATSDTVRMIVAAAPTVDVKVNSSDGPLNFYEPAGFTVTWTSSNASSCSASDNLTGPIGTTGTKSYSNVLKGGYRYTVQCSNAAGTTVNDSVVVNVNPLPPVADLKIDGSDGPLTRVSPAGFTLSWTSQYAATCTASSSDNGWTGNMNLSGTTPFANIPVGTHTYTLTCTNVSGSVSDTATVYVVAPVTGTITIAYAKLLLDAPNLGQPAQTLSGTVSGGEPPYSIMVHVRTPTGSEATFSKSGNSWSLTPASSGQSNFGTTEKGTWTAWAVITDLAGRTFRTTSMTWDVSWHPVHGRP
jgi:hypothetical protein